jgi:hypothetical protein
LRTGWETEMQTSHRSGDTNGGKLWSWWPVG